MQKGRKTPDTFRFFVMVRLACIEISPFKHMMFQNHIVTSIPSPSRRYYEPPVGLIAQLIAHRYRRGHGFESRLSLIFFGFTFDTAFLSYIHNFDNLQCLKHILPSQFKYVFIYVSNYYLPLLAQKSLFVSFSLHKEAKRTISGRASTNRPREQSSVWKRTNHSLLSGRTIHGKHW